MNFFKKLFSSFPSPSPRKDYNFKVKCRRCGEIIEGHIDLANDLSVEYEESGDLFYSRKVLIGENRCFQRIEVLFKFSADKTLIDSEITGGEFVS
jgi:hypothetical protein